MAESLAVVKGTLDLLVLRALSWQAVLLVWLYVMANVTVLGAEVNWHLRRTRAGTDIASAARPHPPEL